MCCGVLFTEVMFLVLYVLTAPALTISSGPHLLMHLYVIYTGYTFLGLALSSLSPFLREVIQVCVCGVVLMCYPLALIPAPIMSCLATALLSLSPLFSLIEGYSLYQLITKSSRLLTSQLEENEGLAKCAILAVSAASIAASAYISVYCIDLPPATKVVLFGLACLVLAFNIAVEEGVISDACLLILANYMIAAAALSQEPSSPPTFSSAPQAATMLGALVRLPHLVSFGVSSVVPFAKQLLAPGPLSMLAVRAISVASFSDGRLGEESWARGMGKFLVVTMYTSYVLGATQRSAALVLFEGGCRAAEVLVLMGAYTRFLLGHCQLDDSF